MAEPASSPTPDVAETSADGRRLRRDRNITAVLDATLAMMNEETMQFSVEMAAERSGLSPRSVYRYFPDQEALIKATIAEVWRRFGPLGHLPSIGEGLFENRVADFSAMRVRLYEHVGPAFRAARIHAPTNTSIRADLARTRLVFSDQFEQQFRPELDALPSGLRSTRGTAADLGTGMDAIDLLRRVRRYTVQESIDVLAETLRVCLTP